VDFKSIFGLLFFAVEGRVEGDAAGGKVIGFYVPARFRPAVDAVHPDILPFDRERATVPDIVQRDDNFFESNVPVPDRSKIPVAAVVTKVGVPPENTDIPRAVSPPGVLHVGVIDPVFELQEEFHVINTLISKMRWVVVEAKSLVMFDRV